MKWLRKWWRAYLQAVRDEIASSKQRKRRTWPTPQDHMNRINPATGLPMMGLVDAGGNPYGSCSDCHQETPGSGGFSSHELTAPDMRSQYSDYSYHGGTNHESGYHPMNWD